MHCFRFGIKLLVDQSGLSNQHSSAKYVSSVDFSKMGVCVYNFNVYTLVLNIMFRKNIFFKWCQKGSLNCILL